MRYRQIKNGQKEEEQKKSEKSSLQEVEQDEVPKKGKEEEAKIIRNTIGKEYVLRTCVNSTCN